MICHLQKPCGWWNAAAFHQPLLSFSPTENVNYTNAGTPFLPPLQQTGHPGTSTPYRDKSELQNYVPPRRFRYASSHRFRTPPHTHVLSRRGANHAVAPKSAVAEPACRQYRVVRWFLLPEAGLRRRSYCRRPGSVGAAFHQPLLSLSPTKNVNYTPAARRVKHPAMEGALREAWRRTRHCGSRGENRGQASLTRSPHPTSVRNLPYRAD